MGRPRHSSPCGQLRRSSVEIFLQNSLTAEEILNLEIPHVVLATGAVWRRDGIGRGQYEPVPIVDGTRVYTPEDLYQGKLPESPVVVYDSDHYYMGGVLCEHLRRLGLEVTLITPAAVASQWTVNTLEQERIQSRLLGAGAPNDSLYEQLMAREADFAASGVRSLARIGDCLTPSTIAAAVYAGHRFAREFESEPNTDVPFLMERPSSN